MVFTTLARIFFRAFTRITSTMRILTFHIIAIYAYHFFLLFYPLPIGCGAFLTPTMFTHFYLLNFSMSVIIFTALCNSFPQRIPTMGIMSTIFTFGHLISLRLFSSKIQMPIATSSLTAPAYFFFFNSIVNAPANIGSSLNCCGANPISALASIKS